MSAFDDEFGLFGESEEPERRPSVGRSVGGPETAATGVEREEQRARRTPPPRRTPQPQPPSQPQERSRRPRERRSDDPWAGHRRATAVLDFLARKLVTQADSVNVELFVDEHAQPVIELVVAPDDIGKVIGRNGRVAHALRTIVRATAEGRVSVDILDTEEAARPVEDAPDA